MNKWQAQLTRLDEFLPTKHSGFFFIRRVFARLPRHLVDSRQRSTRFPGGNIKSAKDRLDEVSLQFVVAWTFIFPLLSNPEAVKFLEKAYPGFVLEMKDTFISLVTEGPFPCALSDFRGRRHRAHFITSSNAARQRYPSQRIRGSQCRPTNRLSYCR